MKSCLKTSAALSSGGTPTPVEEHERLLMRVLTARVIEGKRVRVPIRSAMNWSTEIELWNEAELGCCAPVRKQTSAGCPLSTPGNDTPLKTEKSPRCSCSSSR